MCRLVRRAGRRTGMHSWSRAAFAPTCGLLAASTSVLVSFVDYHVRATHSRTRAASDCAECAMHCAEVHDTM